MKSSIWLLINLRTEPAKVSECWTRKRAKFHTQNRPMCPCRLCGLADWGKGSWGHIMYWVWMDLSYLYDNWIKVFQSPVRQTDYYIKEECSWKIKGSYYFSSTQSWRGCTWGHTFGYFKWDVEIQEQVQDVSVLQHMISKETWESWARSLWWRES